MQAPDKRDGLSPLTLAIGSVFVLLILLVVTNGLDGLGGMAISTPESVPPIVSPSAERSPMLELGQLAFVRDENGQPVVYLAQTNGTRRLIEGWLPALSPDGSQVAYVSNQSGSEQLYLINTVGGSPTRLTNTPQEKLSPAWSPNTHGLLAFIGGDGILYTVKADSRGNPLRLPSPTNMEIGQVTHFAWSPDGRELLFDAQQDGERRIYRNNAEDSALFQLMILPMSGQGFDSWAPAWSPTGQIALSSERGIHTLDAQGKNQRRLTTFRAWWPAWSSDGQQIAFLSDRGNSQLNPELWLMDADGRQQRRLTTSGAN